jgi:hypothetical protein
MWNIKTEVMPAITGVNGTISKSFKQQLSSILQENEIRELQKIAILGTAHILREEKDIKDGEQHHIYHKL